MFFNSKTEYFHSLYRFNGYIIALRVLHQDMA
jgi:hypothetical protein